MVGPIYSALTGETTVGRDDDQGITITDLTVSSRHASFDVVNLPDGGKSLTVKVTDVLRGHTHP